MARKGVPKVRTGCLTCKYKTQGKVRRNTAGLQPVHVDGPDVRRLHAAAAGLHVLGPASLGAGAGIAQPLPRGGRPRAARPGLLPANRGPRAVRPAGQLVLDQAGCADGARRARDEARRPGHKLAVRELWRRRRRGDARRGPAGRRRLCHPALQRRHLAPHRPADVVPRGPEHGAARLHPLHVHRVSARRHGERHQPLAARHLAAQLGRRHPARAGEGVSPPRHLPLLLWRRRLDVSGAAGRAARRRGRRHPRRRARVSGLPARAGGAPRPGHRRPPPGLGRARAAPGGGCSREALAGGRPRRLVVGAGRATTRGGPPGVGAPRSGDAPRAGDEVARLQDLGEYVPGARRDRLRRPRGRVRAHRGRGGKGGGAGGRVDAPRQVHVRHGLRPAAVLCRGQVSLPGAAAQGAVAAREAVVRAGDAVGRVDLVCHGQEDRRD